MRMRRMAVIAQCPAIAAALIAGTLAAAAGVAQAQDYPSRPIKIIVGNAPGGSSDIAARMLGDHLAAAFNQPVVIENKAGANTALAVSAVVHAPPDGYTLLLGTPSLSTFKIYLKNPDFDVEKDLAPISQLLASPFVVTVNAQLPVKGITDLIDLAKKEPGKLNYGAFGGGQILATELFKKMAGIDLVRVPYQSEAPSVTGLASNDVQVVFATAVTVKPMAETGRIKPIAVTTTTRLPSMPEVPTVIESGGPPYDVELWFGLLAPAGTPAAVQQKLAREVAAFAGKPEVKDKFLPLGFTTKSSTPDEFRKLIADETQKWMEVAKFASIVPQ
jgi:tripartite-type tricarboxylate transporter receptor subunit TctC